MDPAPSQSVALDCALSLIWRFGAYCITKRDLESVASFEWVEHWDVIRRFRSRSRSNLAVNNPSVVSSASVAWCQRASVLVVGVTVVMMDGGYIDGQMMMIQRIKGAKPVKQTNKHGNPILGCNSTKSKQHVTCLWEKKIRCAQMKRRMLDLHGSSKKLRAPTRMLENTMQRTI